MAVTLHFVEGAPIQVTDAASIIADPQNPENYALSTALPGATGGQIIGSGPRENLLFAHYEN